MTGSRSFTSINLREDLIANLETIGYDEMTLVQAETLPAIVAGQDVLARAKTGSGKTAAFGLGLLNALEPERFVCQALVLCPTRELADQVAKELRTLARAIPNIKILTLCGGLSFGPQVGSLQHSPHIVVGTPGRVLKHLRKTTLLLSDLQTLVLDEADRMLDMGFAEEIEEIHRFLPLPRQTLLFSATYPDSIGEISQHFQDDPVVVDVTDDEQPASIVQTYFEVQESDRMSSLLSALYTWGGALNLVFCNTKVDCAEVVEFLQSKKVAAVALHGDLEQHERSEVLVRFSNKSATVLVATDVAARGIDIKSLDAVFNYELPKQAEVYVHRIGRTGRASESGDAITLTTASESWRWKAIKELLPDAFPRRVAAPTSKRGNPKLIPEMMTIQINGGRRNKLRPGDLLGALTADNGVAGKRVGDISLMDTCAYIAVEADDAKKAQQQLSNRPIKGRRYRARIRY
ncbi:MAG: ATP-dependent RNA helicase DbpA [Woeseiaceae bacterium]